MLEDDMRRAMMVGLMLAASALPTARAMQPPPTPGNVPVFWLGFLHGVIAPFSLIGSLFYDVRIYAFLNSGWWHDLGFFLGIAGAPGDSARYGA
jgi:hypothetical protein